MNSVVYGVSVDFEVWNVSVVWVVRYLWCLSGLCGLGCFNGFGSKGSFNWYFGVFQWTSDYRCFSALCGIQCFNVNKRGIYFSNSFYSFP